MSLRPPKAAQRLVADNQGNMTLRVHGLTERLWSDAYHTVIASSWWGFVAVAAVAYCALHLLFGALYWLDPHAIANSNGSFGECFFFSVQTMMTIGYGAMSPLSTYAHVLVSIEAFVGLFATALLTGVVFAKFARPHARVMFSNVVCVAQHDGVRSLLFRIANERGNRIVDASVSVSVARNTQTVEGQSFRRVDDLVLRRHRNPLFFVGWTVIHSIDESSPFYRTSLEDLERVGVEVIVVLTGSDETLAQQVFARKSYRAQDFRFDHRFVDIVTRNVDGTIDIDYTRFHETQVATASSV